MDFDGVEEFPPLRQQEGEQEQKENESAEQPDDVAGSVDLQEGGKIESKRWAGDDNIDKEADEGNGKQANKKQEDIQTDGGVRQSGIEMEGAKEETDESSVDNANQKSQKHQEAKNEQPPEPEAEENEGTLQGPSTDGEAEAHQNRTPEYKQKLQEESPGVEEETGEVQEEDVDKAWVNSEEETGDATTGQEGNAQQQQVKREGITDGWSDDVQLEENVALDDEGGIGEEDESDAAEAGETKDTEPAGQCHDGASDVQAKDSSGDDGGGVKEAAVDGTDPREDQGEEVEQQQNATDEDTAAGDSDEQTQKRDAEMDSRDAPSDGTNEGHLDGVDESDGKIHQDPSIQGLAAPPAEENPANDKTAQEAEKRQQQPKQRKNRQRMAFGIEGDSSLVQRETIESDADNDGATEDDAGARNDPQGGDASAADSLDSGCLARTGTDSIQQTETSLDSKQLPHSLLPDNPLEEDEAVERWLQRVRLLNQSDGEMEGDTQGVYDAERMEMDGETPDGNGESGEDKAESEALQSNQLCQRDNGAGNQKAFAEASESAAAKPSSNTKLADAEYRDGEDSERRQEREDEENTESERILSTVSRAKSLKETCTDEKHENTCSNDDGDAGSVCRADDEGKYSGDEASEQLFQELTDEPGIAGEKTSQQQQQQDTAAGSNKGHDSTKDEEEQMASMVVDFQERVTLDDIGKKGLSPEHAAALWHLLESRTAAAAAALSEALRLVLQPTATGAWEGGYRTGKKLSLRRVLAFVASSQRDDRLWLRRRRPRGLQYRVVVGIDCSRSMQQLNAAASALEAVVLLAQAFNHLQIGTVSVCTFGGPKPEVCVHPTNQVSAADGQRLLQRCNFREESHKSHEVAISDLLQLAMHELEKESNDSNSNSMLLILSDGRFNKEQARPWVNAAIARRCIPLLLILDFQRQKQRGEDCSVSMAHEETPFAAVKPSSSSSSIFDLKQVQQQPGGGIEVTPYLQDFPFPYYAVVNDTEQLPSILADVIRQWVEAAANDW